MHKKPIFYEFLSLVVLIVLIAMCFAPMPSSAYMMVHSSLLVLYAVFVALVWRARAVDEREESHKALAAETAFVVGGIVLLVGVASQSYIMHDVDPWLLGALGAMLIVRVGVRIYLDKYR